MTRTRPGVLVDEGAEQTGKQAQLSIDDAQSLGPTVKMLGIVKDEQTGGLMLTRSRVENAARWA